MSKLYGGIDIGLKEFHFHAMDGDGNPIGKPKRFSNNVPGMEQLVEHLDVHIHKQEATSVTLGMEATGLYWFPLFHALQQNERIAQWNTQLLAMNPKLVESFRHAYPDVDKTDKVDALIIADRVRFGRGIAPQHIHNEQFLGLQRLTRFYVHLIQQQTDLKNYASSFLYLTFSEWIRCKPFSDRYGATACRLMKKYKSAEEMAEVTADELQTLLKDFSKNHFRDPKQKAEDVLQMVQDSFVVPQGLVDSVHLLIKQTLQQLDLLDKHLNRLMKQIEKAMKGIKHPLLSIPGIGPVSAALIIAEIGDISRFEVESKLAKYAGLTWRTKQSGNFRAEETFMTKTGNVYLRRGLMIAAQSMVNHNDEYNDYYQRKFKEATRHAHKRALSLTARKLVRLVHAMLSTNQLYMTPEERMKRNKEVDNQTNAPAPVDNVSVTETPLVDTMDTVGNTTAIPQPIPKKEHKKAKGTAAATSSTRQRAGTQRTQHPKEHAVSS
ncbi:IS110 family transposase [uncultured Paenibacillus sp.]|uniref:IS110 family transposase n=1 Tax=uncultured Paenibacillus sp. TaxID=227322 RepID=UPI0028D669C0|nr:IS110 family transposase [uncultured Paenibacillus sp.]